MHVVQFLCLARSHLDDSSGVHDGVDADEDLCRVVRREVDLDVFNPFDTPCLRRRVKIEDADLYCAACSKLSDHCTSEEAHTTSHCNT